MIARGSRWIVTTPRRAVIAAAIAFVLIVGVPAVQLLRGLNTIDHAVGRAAAARQTPSPTPAQRLRDPLTGQMVPPSGSATSDTPTSATASGTARVATAAATVAQQFTARWLAGRTAASTEAWVSTLRPLVAPALVQPLQLTNRTAIPIGRAGRPVGDAQGDETSQRFVVPANATLSLSVDLDWDGRRWQVYSFGPAA